MQESQALFGGVLGWVCEVVKAVALNKRFFEAKPYLFILDEMYSFGVIIMVTKLQAPKVQVFLLFGSLENASVAFLVGRSLQKALLLPFFAEMCSFVQLYA